MKAKSLTDMTDDLRRLTGASAAADLFAETNGAEDAARQERMRVQAARLIVEALGPEVRRSLQDIGSAHRQAIHDLSAQQRDHLGRLIEAAERALVTLQQEREDLEARVAERAADAAVAAVEHNLLPVLERLLVRQQALQQPIRATPSPDAFRPRRSAPSPLMLTLWGVSVVVAVLLGAAIARAGPVLAVWHGL